MLIKVSKHTVPVIGTLHWLAAKYVFEREAFTELDHAELEEGICAWYKKVDLTVDERLELDRIVDWLEIADPKHPKHDKVLWYQEIMRIHKVMYKQLFSRGLPFLNLKAEQKKLYPTFAVTQFNPN